MPQTSEPEHRVTTLASAGRLRVGARRNRAWLALGGFVATLAIVDVGARRTDPDCRAVSRAATDSIAVVVCEREYHRTLDPEVGAILADAYRRSGDRAVASALANGLLATPARGDALYVLGKIAVAKTRVDDAVSLLTTARELHRARQAHSRVAKDDQAIAGIFSTRQQYASALRSLDECIQQARAGGDALIEGYCHMSAASVLSEVGYFAPALRELERAAGSLRSDRDLAWLEAQRGNLYQDYARSPTHDGYHVQAIVAYEDVLRRARRAQLPTLAVSAELNLAYSMAEVLRTDDAEQHLRSAAALDRDNAYESDRAQLEARIAYRRGALTHASALNDRLYAAVVGHDDRRRVCAMQARIALASGDLTRAEDWARRGIAEVEQTRTAQSILELRSWVLSTRREPYELLFSALARGGRAEEALQVFDRWQGRSLLDALARQRQPPLADLHHVADHVDRLGAWLTSVSSAPLADTESTAAMTELRAIDLLAFVVAEHRLWRVAIAAGQAQLADLGPFAKLREPLERFRAKPTDPALAEQLGQLLIPDATFRSTRDALRVVLDGPLAGLPVVALRRHGQPLIALRPVVHAPRVSEAVCGSRTWRPGKSVVLADASGDLPDARGEAAEIATLLGTSRLVGPAATSAALFAASDSDVLHVATHADIGEDGGVLRLHDESISALEISARGRGPGLVVLAACASAASADLEAATSLASAFLAAGSIQVVATLRPISDAGAADITSRFYRAGGVTDPVRVLAEIQASLAGTPNADWPSFAVFGRDLCTAAPH